MPIDGPADTSTNHRPLWTPPQAPGAALFAAPKSPGSHQISGAPVKSLSPQWPNISCGAPYTARSGPRPSGDHGSLLARPPGGPVDGPGMPALHSWPRSHLQAFGTPCSSFVCGPVASCSLRYRRAGWSCLLSAHMADAAGLLYAHPRCRRIPYPTPGASLPVTPAATFLPCFCHHSDHCSPIPPLVFLPTSTLPHLSGRPRAPRLPM